MATDLYSSCDLFLPMNEDADNTEVRDFSRQLNHGVASANTSVMHTTGIVDGGFYFDKTNEITLGSTQSLTGFYTIAFFAKWDFDGTARPSDICGKTGGPGHNIYVQDVVGSKTVFFVNSAGASVSWIVPSIADAWRWYTFVSVNGGTTIQLWIDNVSISAQAINTDIDINLIGNGSGVPFFGDMDIFCLFDRQLTEAERDFLYNSGNGVEVLRSQKLCYSAASLNPLITMDVAKLSECA